MSCLSFVFNTLEAAGKNPQQEKKPPDDIPESAPLRITATEKTSASALGRSPIQSRLLDSWEVGTVKNQRNVVGEE